MFAYDKVLQTNLYESQQKMLSPFPLTYPLLLAKATPFLAQSEMVSLSAKVVSLISSSTLPTDFK